MFNLNPKKMQEVMKKMGIKQDEIDAKRVVIEKDGGNIVIENPSVSKINMQGQESWQITGEAREETAESEKEEKISEDDIKTVMEKTGCSEKQAMQKLEETEGDIAKAIIELS